MRLYGHSILTVSYLLFFMDISDFPAEIQFFHLPPIFHLELRDRVIPLEQIDASLQPR